MLFTGIGMKMHVGWDISDNKNPRAVGSSTALHHTSNRKKKEARPLSPFPFGLSHFVVRRQAIRGGGGRGGRRAEGGEYTYRRRRWKRPLGGGRALSRGCSHVKARASKKSCAWVIGLEQFYSEGEGTYGGRGAFQCVIMGVRQAAM